MIFIPIPDLTSCAGKDESAQMRTCGVSIMHIMNIIMPISLSRPFTHSSLSYFMDFAPVTNSTVLVDEASKSLRALHATPSTSPPSLSHRLHGVSSSAIPLNLLHQGPTSMLPKSRYMATLAVKGMARGRNFSHSSPASVRSIRNQADFRRVPNHRLQLVYRSSEPPSERTTEAGTPSNLIRLNHLDDQSQAHMVSIADKISTKRSATAFCFLGFSHPETFKALKQAQNKKGDAIAVARVAGIQAAKKTSDLIPLAHPSLAITGVKIDIRPFSAKKIPPKLQGYLQPDMEHGGVAINATVDCEGKTGVEMEAITAASVTGLTMYDMLKGMDKAMHLTAIRVIAKSGGKSGDWEYSWRERRNVQVQTSNPTSTKAGHARTEDNGPTSRQHVSMAKGRLHSQWQRVKASVATKDPAAHSQQAAISDITKTWSLQQQTGALLLDQSRPTSIQDLRGEEAPFKMAPSDEHTMPTVKTSTSNRADNSQRTSNPEHARTDHMTKDGHNSPMLEATWDQQFPEATSTSLPAASPSIPPTFYEKQLLQHTQEKQAEFDQGMPRCDEKIRRTKASGQEAGSRPPNIHSDGAPSRSEQAECWDNLVKGGSVTSEDLRLARLRRFTKYWGPGVPYPRDTEDT